MARHRKRRRKHRRSRGRNTWFGNRKGHRLAALKGWRRRRKVKGSKKGRRRRKGGRRRRRGLKFRGRRGRRGRRSRRGRKGRRGRRRAYNVGGSSLTLRRPLQAVTAAYNINTLGRAGVMVGGALGNAWLTGAVSGFLPSMLQSGVGGYVVGLASAGVLGAGVGMVAPRYASDVFLGGVLEVMTRVVKQYVVPMLPGMSGLGDYLTVANAQEARPLGDYLTVANAQQARPLGDYYGDEYISEELAAY